MDRVPNHHCTVNPPSTANAWPVTKVEPGLHSQSTASAISSPRLRRFIGRSRRKSSTANIPLSSIFDTIGVSIVPGQTALTRMLRAAYSSAALRVNPITPCLVP